MFSWCSPLSWLRNHSKLGVSGLRFVNARFPYLFCVTFLCVLRARPVVVHICMRVIHILPSPSSSSLLTSQSVDVTWCVIFIIPKNRYAHAQFLKKVLKLHSFCRRVSVVYRPHIVSCMHHSGKPDLLSLPPSISCHPQLPLPLLVLEDTDVTRCRWCGWQLWGWWWWWWLCWWW